MKIQQWEDKGLAQFSYAILSECERKIVLIDPARNPKPYIDFAAHHQAQITGVIETHPHADFVSSHLELYERLGATIYTSNLVKVFYPHQGFDEGNTIELGKIRLHAVNTPGHSPDSISVVLEHEGRQKAVFTGDTLFIGDCGRPDLREGAGHQLVTRKELARQMYYSLREKLMTLPEDVIVYPAHGAGTLCGKALKKAQSSTIGEERATNWSLQKMSEEEFVEQLLADQPFIPAYFPYDVELNRKGAPGFNSSIEAIKIGPAILDASGVKRLDKSNWIIDARDEKTYKQGHLRHSINLMDGDKFETWLGSIIQPGEAFYLAASSQDQLEKLFERCAAIGYEGMIKEGFILQYAETATPKVDLTLFRKNADAYTIIDVRNSSEVKQKKVFPQSINIPLANLRENINKVPTDKPIIVHCAGGYRSAAASSLLQAHFNGGTKVFDLSEAINQFN